MVKSVFPAWFYCHGGADYSSSLLAVNITAVLCITLPDHRDDVIAQNALSETDLAVAEVVWNRGSALVCPILRSPW